MHRALIELFSAQSTTKNDIKAEEDVLKEIYCWKDSKAEIWPEEQSEKARI